MLGLPQRVVDLGLMLIGITSILGAGLVPDAGVLEPDGAPDVEVLEAWVDGSVVVLQLTAPPADAAAWQANAFTLRLNGAIEHPGAELAVSNDARTWRITFNSGAGTTDEAQLLVPFPELSARTVVPLDQTVVPLEVRTAPFTLPAARSHTAAILHGGDAYVYSGQGPFAGAAEVLRINLTTGASHTVGVLPGMEGPVEAAKDRTDIVVVLARGSPDYWVHTPSDGNLTHFPNGFTNPAAEPSGQRAIYYSGHFLVTDPNIGVIYGAFDDDPNDPRYHVQQYQTFLGNDGNVESNRWGLDNHALYAPLWGTASYVGPSLAQAPPDLQCVRNCIYVLGGWERFAQVGGLTWEPTNGWEMYDPTTRRPIWDDREVIDPDGLAPEPFVNASATWVGDRALVFGAMSSGEVLAFGDRPTGGIGYWVDGRLEGPVREGPVSVQVGNEVWVIGGETWDGVPLDRIDRYPVGPPPP